MKQIIFHYGKPKIPKPNHAPCMRNLLFGFGLLLFVLIPSGANAQSTLNASGGSGNIAGNLYAYSIGEMVLVSTETGGSITVTQGVLQPNVNFVGVEDQTFLAEGLALYPNPVANTLYLQPSLPGGGELSLHLFDLRGRLIMKNKVDLQTGSERQQLNLSSLQEGTYVLKANLQQGERTYDHSFKILKLGK